MTDPPPRRLCLVMGVNHVSAMVLAATLGAFGCTDPADPPTPTGTTTEASDISQTGLLLWLDATDPAGDGSTVATGTPLATWVDKASGRAVVQPVASRQPVLRTGAIAGKPAVWFDGVDDALDLDVDIDASVLPEVTVVAVIQNQAGQTGSYAGVWGQDNGGWDRLLSSGGTTAAGVSNGNGFTTVEGLTAESTRLVTTTTFSANTQNGSSVFVNGALAATFTSTARPGTSHLSLGNLNGPGGPTAGYAFDGYVAELLVYNRALSADERAKLDAMLQAKWSPPPLTVAPGAIHAYLFDGPWLIGNTLAKDENGDWGNGEVNQTSAATLGPGARWVPHDGGQAVALSGGASAYVINRNVDFGTGDFSVVIDWAGPFTGSVLDLVSDRDANSHGNFFNIRMRGPQNPLGGNGLVVVEVDQDANGTNYNAIGGGAINDGRWHRIAAVRQGKLLSLAIDGVVVASAAGPGVADVEGYNTSGYGYNPLLVGARMVQGFGGLPSAEPPAQGTFDNLTIYDRALSWAELANVVAPSATQDFDTAPAAWAPVSGAWTWNGAGASSLSVAQGTLGAVTQLRGFSAADFAVETRMRLDGTIAGDAGLLLRGMNFSPVTDGGQQYYCGIHTSLGVFCGKENNGWTLLGNNPIAIAPGTYYTLRIEAIGTKLYVYLNGALALTVSDASYASGGLALRSYLHGATYDYVHITADLARGKPTTQNSTSSGGVASRAVDGNPSQTWGAGSMTLTDGGPPQSWQVDLGALSAVTSIVVWSRAASDCGWCGAALANYMIETSVDGTTWTQHAYPGAVPDRLVVPIDAAVRYIRVDQTAASNAPSLSLAEVAAWGTACGPDEIAQPGARCVACPTGLVTTDGTTCTSPTVLTTFAGADYVSRLVAVANDLCLVPTGTGTVHLRTCGRHAVGWFLDEIDDAQIGGTQAYMLRLDSRCLFVDPPGPDGAAVVHATLDGCTTEGNQWHLDWNPLGQLRLHNDLRNVCLAIGHGGARDGDIVIARPCTSESAELWRADTLRPHVVASPLQVSASGLCLQIGAYGQSPQQQTCQGTSLVTQNLQLVSLGDGSVMIEGDGGCLAVTQGAREGTPLVIDNCDASTVDRWVALPLDGGGLSLISMSSGYCAELPSTAAGAVPVQRQCTGATTQRVDQMVLTGAMPMRATLQDIGGTEGTALVIANERGVYITRDPSAIALFAQGGGADLTDPTQLDHLEQLLSPEQRGELDATLVGGPTGLAGSISFDYYPYTPALSSASGTYTFGNNSGTFAFQDIRLSGSNTQQLPLGVSETVEWEVNPLDGPGLDGAYFDSPLGRAGFHADIGLYDVFVHGQVGASVQLGNFTLGLSLGVHGVAYTGPDPTPYIRTADKYIARGVVDGLTSAPSWGAHVYPQVTGWVATLATDLANAISSGYPAVAKGVSTAISAVEDFFGSIGRWF